jgi:uncharacterized membrane protein YfhO
VVEFFIIGERFVGITRQLQAAEALSKLSTMNDKSSFVKVPLVITKQLKLYFTQERVLFHISRNISRCK